VSGDTAGVKPSHAVRLAAEFGSADGGAHRHNPQRVESSLAPLLALFERERSAGRALVLGIVLETAGSTYRKPGALMLIASDGDYAGLLSGGCLEGDLREHASKVRESGEPKVVSYDLRGPDDLLWGLGVGCEGAMNILLIRVSEANGWQPISHFLDSLRAHCVTAVGIVVEGGTSGRKAGDIILPRAHSSSPPQPPLDRVEMALLEQAARRKASWLDVDEPGAKIFGLALALPPRVLLLGAGPDTLPIVDFASRLGWKVTLVDHRPAYAKTSRFPAAEKVIHARPEELGKSIDTRGFDAAVVMSHHLASDLTYLTGLAKSEIPYVGLLGPAIRREKLLKDMGDDADALRPRLRAPVGLALGGRAPESIALAIVAEIHAFIHGSEGGPFTGNTG
jgi:xanthine/CO dehydrogenase XdhC/CoxF family maturation factor